MEEAASAPGRFGIERRWFALATLAAVAVIAFNIGKVPVADEPTMHAAMWTAGQNGYPLDDRGNPQFWHVPTYFYLGGWLSRLWGGHWWVARMVGVFSLLVEVIAAACLARRLGGRAEAGWVAAALVLCSPFAVNGSLVLDIDNTILSAALVLSTLAFVNLADRPSRGSFALAAASVTWAWLCKESTPMLLLVWPLAYWWFARLPWKRGGHLVAAFVVGTLIGLALYQVISGPAHWDVVATMERNRGTVRANALPMDEGLPRFILTKGQEALLICFWLTPVLALLLGREFVLTAKAAVQRYHPDPATGATLALTAAITLGYWVVGKCTFGFARYWHPVVPLSAAVLAAGYAGAWTTTWHLRDRGERKQLLVAILWMTLILGLANDPIELLTRTVKQVVLGTEPQWALLRGVIGCAGWAVFTGYVVKTLRQVGPLDASVPAVLTAQLLGLAAQQCRPHLTAYNYGARGTSDVLRAIRTEVPANSYLCAAREFWVYGGVAGAQVPDTRWNDPNYLLTYLKDPRVSACVIGSVSHTRDQLQVMRREPLAGFLAASFNRREIGDYTVWIKRDTEGRSDSGPIRPASPVAPLYP